MLGGGSGMTGNFSGYAQPRLISSFDSVIEAFSSSNISFTEEEALKTSHWEKGEDARLREDFRFRSTPGGRWILSHNLLANEALSKWFRSNLKSAVSLDSALDALGTFDDRKWVFCPEDRKFVLEDGVLRLAAGQLTDEPLVEEPLEISKYTTHLPIHTLDAVAASEPSGEWGPQAQEELIETFGWLRVTLPHKLNDRMFVAQIKGNSMNDGRSGLVNGAYAVFELWPAGTRQNKIVLVRGAFKDPETGSYALKKYVADVRDKEGRHQRISLVSLNPDKDHYPDIELNPEDDETVFVIAQYLAALSGNQFSRKPKPLPRKTTRRNLTDSYVSGKMQKRVKEIFGEKEEGVDTKGHKLDWASRLVCLDFEGGGLHAETRPLTWLPNFVKRVTLQAGSKSSIILGTNLKNRTWRQMVPPSRDGYEWSAPGFEEDVGEELAGLTIPCLSEHIPALFKVDAAGIGQPIVGKALSPGQEYRMVVPPDQRVHEVMVGICNDLDFGWQLWDFVMPVEPDREVQNLLAGLQLDVGKTAPRLCWVGFPPVSYRQTPRGETYPCFHVKRPPILSIKGLSIPKSGKASVFVFSGDQFTSASLPEGDEWTIALDELPVGPAMVRVLHEKPEIAPVNLPFFVANKTDETVKAEIAVQIAGEKKTADENGLIVAQHHLGKIEGEGNELEIAGPPLWQVRSHWQDTSSSLVKNTHISDTGEMDLVELMSQTREKRERLTPGNWHFDFAELGHIDLHHDPIPDPEDLIERLVKLIDEKGTALTGFAGQFPLLKNLWLDPLLPLMGLEGQTPSSDDLGIAPAGMTAMLLFHTRRKSGGEIERTKHSILVLVTNKEDINRSGEDSAWEYADRLCKWHRLTISIISDGKCWMRHRINSRMKGNVYDLLDIVKQASDGELEPFLSECGGW
jgi:hypothetical protein